MVILTCTASFGQPTTLTLENTIGLFADRVTLGSEYLLVKDFQENVHLFDISLPLSPVEAGIYDPSGICGPWTSPAIISISGTAIPAWSS